jgi:hypothetical protein
MHACSIALGQFKAIFGYGPVARETAAVFSLRSWLLTLNVCACSPHTGKDFTSSTKLHELIRSYIDWRGELNTRAAWSGWLWIVLLLIFKYVGRVDKVRRTRAVCGLRLRLAFAA